MSPHPTAADVILSRPTSPPPYYSLLPTAALPLTTSIQACPDSSRTSPASDTRRSKVTFLCAGDVLLGEERFWICVRRRRAAGRGGAGSACAGDVLLGEGVLDLRAPATMRLGSRSTVRDGGGDRVIERWVGLAVDLSEGIRAVLKWVAGNLLCSGNKLLLLHVLKDSDYETPTNRRFQGVPGTLCGKIQMNTSYERSNKLGAHFSEAEIAVLRTMSRGSCCK